jgi:hypothetical protein
MSSYHSMHQEIDRESLDYLLSYPEMPPGFPVPVAIEQDPEVDTTAPIPIKREPGLKQEGDQEESAAIEAEDADTKAEKPHIKQEIAVVEHLAHTYRARGQMQRVSPFLVSFARLHGGIGASFGSTGLFILACTRRDALSASFVARIARLRRSMRLAVDTGRC